ncbi:hypothetical protein EC2788150_4053 [Escherichia coli 2788150]|nr:hypothetical protein EC2788150_4053 [Escherichia coli 2788150]
MNYRLCLISNPALLLGLLLNRERPVLNTNMQTALFGVMPVF